jgi:hypothetical protein
MAIPKPQATDKPAGGSIEIVIITTEAIIIIIDTYDGMTIWELLQKIIEELQKNKIIFKDVLGAYPVDMEGIPVIKYLPSLLIESDSLGHPPTSLAYSTSDSGISFVGVTAFVSGVNPIPTLSEWGLIIFAVLLVGFMTWVVIRRRRRVTIGI